MAPLLEELSPQATERFRHNYTVSLIKMQSHRGHLGKLLFKRMAELGGVQAADQLDPGALHHKTFMGQARSREMNALAEEVRREVLAAHVGTEDEVLLETPLSETLFTGYTRLYIPVVVSAPGHKSGEIVHVRLGEYDGERVRAALC